MLELNKLNNPSGGLCLLTLSMRKVIDDQAQKDVRFHVVSLVTKNWSGQNCNAKELINVKMLKLGV